MYKAAPRVMHPGKGVVVPLESTIARRGWIPSCTNSSATGCCAKMVGNASRAGKGSGRTIRPLMLKALLVPMRRGAGRSRFRYWREEMTRTGRVSGYGVGMTDRKGVDSIRRGG